MLKIRETVELALSLHTGCKRVILISDHHVLTAQLTEEEARKQLAPLADRITLEQVPDLPFPAMLRWLQKQSTEDTIALMLLYSKDSDGRNLPVIFAMDRIREACPVPIYAVWDFYLGHGPVGGVMLSGYETGRDAGRRTLNLLLGRDTSTMPIDTLEASHLCFDWETLQALNIPPHLLPPQAHIEGRPRSLAERLGIWYYILLGVLALETLLVTALISMTLQRRRTMAGLQLRQFIVDQADFPILVVDRYGRIQFINHSACQVLGYLRDQLLDKHISLVSPEVDFSPERFPTTYEETVSHSEVGRTTFLRNRQGRDLRYRLRMAPIKRGSETLCSITAIDQRDLQRQLEVLQYALKHAELGIMLCHKDGSIFYANDMLCTLTGRDREELLHQQVSQLDPRISEGWVDRQWKHLRRQGVLRMQMKRNVPQPGKGRCELWLEITINYVQMEESEFACVFLRDESASKASEQSLRLLAAKKSRIQRAARLGDFTIDMEKRMATLSEVAAELFGFEDKPGTYPLEELTRRVHPADLEMIQQFLSLPREEGVLEIPPHRVFSATQGEVWLRMRGRICRDAAGKIVSVEGSLQDITAQILTEQDLRRQHDFCVSLVETLPLGVSVKDLRRDLAYTVWNAEMARITGRSAGQVLGRKDEELHSEVLARRMRREDLRLLEAGNAKTERTLDLSTEKGTRIVHRTRIPLLDAQGVPTALITLLQDVSEQVTQERAERGSEKMRALEQLASGVSRNGGEQFKAILGYATLLEEELTEQRMRDYASAIVHASQQGADFTRLLQAFALDAKRMQVHVDMHRLLHDTLRTFSEELRPGIVLQQFLKAEDARILGDPDQLQLVLQSLLRNAVEALPATGRVTMTSEVVSISASDAQRLFGEEMNPGRYFKLCITDTGSGIEQEVRGRIFEPFFSTRDPQLHLGLGLAAVRGWVGDHGGYIHVYSEVDHGSSFSLYLPLATQTSLMQGTQVTHRPGRILLVDDEELARTTYSRMLERLGYEVEAYADPAQGAVALRKLARDLCAGGARYGYAGAFGQRVLRPHQSAQ